MRMLSRLVVPRMGKADMTGEMAMESAILSIVTPRVSWFLIGARTNLFQSLEVLLLLIGVVASAVTLFSFV